MKINKKIYKDIMITVVGENEELAYAHKKELDG
jgi:hypothetical protein